MTEINKIIFKEGYSSHTGVPLGTITSSVNTAARELTPLESEWWPSYSDEGLRISSVLWPF